MGKIHYGERVVGELAAKRAAKKSKKVRYGSRVTDDQPENVTLDDETTDELAAKREAKKTAPKKKAAKKKAAKKKAAKKKAAAKDPPADPPPPPPAETENVMTEEAFEELMQLHSNDDGFVSIGDLKDALFAAPSSFNRMMAWELNRPEGPRVGAVTHLLEVEQKRDGGPRATVLSALESALKGARSSGRSE